VATNVALNPVYVACDPTNGNFFIASGRDLLAFYVLPAALAPAWSAVAAYTAGQVVSFTNISPPLSGVYIALAGTVAAQSPLTAPSLWALYASSIVTLLSAPDACAGRKSDVVNYPLPALTVAAPVPNNGGPIHFQILPSSVFTQSDGTVQFTASSNLVQVNVNSL
jgi:hypothetical protein